MSTSFRRRRYAVALVAPLRTKGRAAAGSVLAVALLLAPLSGVARADIVGTSGNDKLRGTDGSNTIYARAGNDKVAGLSGADQLHGEEGDDTVKGGEGKDYIYGGTGQDILYGGTGGDRMHGGQGNDRLFGEEGRDSVEGDDGDDEIFVKNREDYAAPGDIDGDAAYGGDGADKIYARDGERDRVSCGPGLDLAVLDYGDVLLDESCERVDRASPESLQDSGKEIAQAARDWALLKEGIAEQPLGSNRGPEIDDWQRRVNMLGVAWCGIFGHEAYWRAGLDLNDRIMSTDWLHDAALRGDYNFQDVAIRDIRPGDLLILDWAGTGDDDDHIAIVTQPYGGNGSVATISGNYGNRVGKASFSTGLVAVAVRVHL